MLNRIMDQQLLPETMVLLRLLPAEQNTNKSVPLSMSKNAVPEMNSNVELFKSKNVTL